MNQTLWSGLLVFVLVPFLRSEDIAPLPASLIQDRQASECVKAYQSSYQERLGLEKSFWTKECGAGKTPSEILRLAVKTKDGISPNFKAGKKGKTLAQNSLRGLDQTKNFGAYYDGGGAIVAVPMSASGLKAGRLPLALPAARASNQKQQAQLLADFEKHLNIVGTPQEKQLIDRTLTDISGSPTARSLMQEFMKSQGQHTVLIGFSDMSRESLLLSLNGIEVIDGNQGEAKLPSLKSSHVTVRLNKLYLQADPLWSRADLTDVLSHELLGHALEYMKAAMTGALDAYGQTALDETEAYLVGWTVSAELPFPATDPRGRQYAREYQAGDLQSYYDNFHIQAPQYAPLLDPQDMDQPIKNLLRRKKFVDQGIENVYLDRRDVKASEFFIEHFKFVHGMINFSSFYSSLKDQEAVDMFRLRSKTEADDILRSAIHYYQTPYGQADLTRLKRSFANPFFPDVEARIKSLSGALPQKLAGKKMFNYGSPSSRSGGEMHLMKTLSADIRKHRADCAAHFKDVIEKYPEFEACNQ